MAATPTHTILCCLCGIPIAPNPSNMCLDCIRTQVDITEGIAKEYTIQWCRTCGRYLQPPNYWTPAELESRELLTLCLKRIRGLNKVRLVDAAFIWTEPHSKRLKLKVTIQKEVFNGAILQQSFVVDFVVLWCQCDACAKTFTPHTWIASVQLRQKTDHKRTFLFLEQLILKHGAHIHTVNIKEVPDGLDFFFSHRSHALKFLEFIGSVTPIKFKSSDQLISSDFRNNTHNIKYSFVTDIPSICREDLVCLPPSVSSNLGGLGPIVICTKINTALHFLDPLTLRQSELFGPFYWKQPFRSLATSRQLIEYIVLDIEPLGPVAGKYALAEAQICRPDDIGNPNGVIFVKTHLGNVLHAGDSALGYDFRGSNFNDENLKYVKNFNTDVVLIKRYREKTKKRNRNWHLKKLNKEGGDDTKKVDQARMEMEQEEFLQELDEDAELRAQINLYKDPKFVPPTNDAMRDDEDNGPQGADNVGVLDINELLDDLTLDDPNAPPDYNQIDIASMDDQSMQ